MHLERSELLVRQVFSPPKGHGDPISIRHLFSRHTPVATCNGPRPWGPGMIDGQHKPHMLENGNIFVFDNGTLRGYSRVIELNPLTEQIEWEYTTEPKEDFFSQCIAGAQRLPNGNNLICEGCKGRLFEVTPKKEIVWDFVNPFLAEYSGKFVYRCLRYSPEYAAPLLDA